MSLRAIKYVPRSIATRTFQLCRRRCSMRKVGRASPLSSHVTICSLFIPCFVLISCQQGAVLARRWKWLLLSILASNMCLHVHAFARWRFMTDVYASQHARICVLFVSSWFFLLPNQITTKSIQELFMLHLARAIQSQDKPRLPFWKVTMQELSAWTRFGESQPAKPETFHGLDEDAKAKFVANSPLRVCQWRYPDLVKYIRNKGGIEEPWTVLACVYFTGECCMFFLHINDLCFSLHFSMLLCRSLRAIAEDMRSLWRDVERNLLENWPKCPVILGCLGLLGIAVFFEVFLFSSFERFMGALQSFAVW